MRPRLDRSSRPMRAQGRPGARCTRGLACNGTKKCAHEHTGPAESIRPSLRNGLTAYAALSPETNSFCLRHRRIDGFANPVGLRENLRRFDTSHGCQDHTVLPYAASFTKPFDRMRPAEVLAKAFSAVRLTRCRSLTENRPANMPARPTLPRPPHLIPTFRDDRDTPLVEGMRCASYEGDLRESGKGNIFEARAGPVQIGLIGFRKLVFWRSGPVVENVSRARMSAAICGIKDKTPAIAHPCYVCESRAVGEPGPSGIRKILNPCEFGKPRFLDTARSEPLPALLRGATDRSPSFALR